MRRARHLTLMLVAVLAALWYVSQRVANRPPARPGDGGLEVSFGPEERVAPGPAGEARPEDPEAVTAPAPRPTWPEPEPGAPYAIELIEPPAASYGGAAWTEDDRKYAGDLEGLDAVAYDPTLGHAARELAVFYSTFHVAAPTEALQFVVNSAGAAEWGVLQSYLTTTDLGEGAVARRVEELAGQLEGGAEGGRVGVGEAYTIGAAPERVVAVIVSRGGLYLDPVPRRVAPGATVTVSGALPQGAERPEVLSFGPDGVFVVTPVEADGERFTATLRAPNRAGAWLLELVATLPHGPTPLAQLELSIGRPLPERFDGHWPPDERAIQDDAAAEVRALALLQADRARSGLPPLTLDPALSRVARAHSADMRDHAFFGHRSPTTGTVTDRLVAARYPTVTHGENIAANPSLYDAEQGLYYSLGHRRNILGPDFTRVGIGVAHRPSHGRRQWLVTQVFGRPVPAVTPAAGRAAVEALVAEGARVRGRAAYAVDAELARVADAEVRSAAPSPSGVLARVKDAGLGSRGAFAWTARVSELDRVQLPEELFTGDYGRVGVAVRQRPDDPAPNIVIVVVVGG
ncbi:MAG: hypothetical protein CVU56_02555 [Deltaproteobacteria bacterium HGW-Deltaproteobacteria-14]|jgi:uncharacterized protein YkwD|nr:MAG: hypothetical protein CVU56_02555 [Deltaproteobacteria bacterium HGW-Deltaproteobacteria-14]